MKKILALTVLFTLVSCGGFQAERVSGDTSDEKSLEITDAWVTRDTENSVETVIQKMKQHKGFKNYLLKLGRRPKVFVAEFSNQTAEPYFPSDDISDEFLTQLSESGEYILIDASAREALLKEIQYQNDGMVSPAEAKKIGNAAGADIMIFGNVRMQPRSRSGKTLKEYTMNIRMTDISRGVEVMRTRTRVNKYSEKSKVGW
ncbi:CsgG/HfaB family protein [Halobacteriovorax sp. HFRX-2_2]|uniref:CsgG/HfaB family protein n=1 Tax=unclassified Halobacteriovorax TaxID=2639665 RepID=UPI003720CB38